jgi:general secretion pathway protein D
VTNGGRAVTVGMQNPTTYSADLDIPFTQNSYALAVPQFGGFDATAGASLGFAILSDIEAYFFINAAQGDTRSNVLQAPKVTLFNGQQAIVSDTSQSPFVISVIPVVGDFAAAQQPVIIVLSEGTFMTVQAVVSNDKRFVRLTVVPFFSKITAVNTFTFTGSTTTTTDSHRCQQALEPDGRHLDEHQLRHHGAVADVLLRYGDHHGERTRRRHRAAGRHQTSQRRPYGIWRADAG